MLYLTSKKLAVHLEILCGTLHEKSLNFQDVCIENSAGHNSRLCAVEFNSTEQLKFCVDAVSSHPLLEVEWICVGPKVDDMDESTLVQLGVRKVCIDLFILSLGAGGRSLMTHSARSKL